MEIEARFINEGMVDFIEKNVKKFPGKSSLKIHVTEAKENYKISLYTMGNGFEMNDEMTAFLEKMPELEVQVVTV